MENGKKRKRKRKIQVFDSFDTIARQRIRKNRNIVDETKKKCRKNKIKINHRIESKNIYNHWGIQQSNDNNI